MVFDSVIVIGLIVVGLVLLIIELFFMPGTHVVGILGLLFVGSAVFIAYYYLGEARGHLTLVSSLVVTTGLVVYTIKSGKLRRFVHTDRQRQDQGFKSFDDVDLGFLKGQIGTTVTMLRPHGSAQFGGKTYEVVSEHDLIERGVRVSVEAVHGRRVTVKRIEQN